MSPGSGTSGRTCMLWRVRLCSAFRTILACSVIYLTTLFAPETLKQLVAYPAYCYLTTILIVSADATLGDALKGFWHALYACVQVLSLSSLSLQLIGPTHFTSHVIAAMAVAMSAFVVALPEGTNLMCKRIAFGQIVIVYVGTATHRSTAQDDHDQDGMVLMQPIQVASSTLLGALASVLAMLFLNLVFYHEASFSSMLSPHLGYHQVGQMCRKYSDNAMKRLNLYLDAMASQDSLTALDIISQAQHLAKVEEKLLHSIKQKQKILRLFKNASRILRLKVSVVSQNQRNISVKRSWNALYHIIPSKASLLFAFKCSLSLGLAVLFGLIYNEKEAYWAGVTIAISFVTGRQATFALANSRAQSTAMGSIYGVLCCFIFQKFEDLSFLPLLPSLIFTSFLRHSRMYGQAGGISAAVGALLILGRKNYGSPIDFTIARITEVVIGLICFVIIEIMACPVRAATLAKLELSHCLGTLQECIKGIVPFDNNQSNRQTSIFPALKQEKLKSQLDQFEKFVVEAELEPNFLFIPFNGACYHNLLWSVSKMGYLSLIMSNKVESLSVAIKRFEVASEDLQSHINSMKNDLDRFKNKACSSLQCLQELSSKKSLAVHNKHDIELGTSQKANESRGLGTHEEDVVYSILSSYLQHSNDLSDGIGTGEGEGDEKLKSQVVLCMGVLGFCITNLLKDVLEMEKEFQELA